MNSFADIKRRIGVGTRLKITGYRYRKPMPHLDALIGQERNVGIVQGNAIAFEDPAKPGVRGAMSWLYWPKAGEIKLTGPNSFEVDKGEEFVAIAYEFVA